MKAIVLFIIGLLFTFIAFISLTLKYANIPFEYLFDFNFLYLINEESKILVKSGIYAFLTILILPIIVAASLYKPKSHKRFGDAKFANNHDLKKYGYLGNYGVILGQTKWLKKLIISHGPKTIGLSAKPRSGKGVSFVIPNLLTWDGSVVCIDIKKELFQITSGFRAANGQKIIVFDPMDENRKSHSINIFDDVSKDEDRRVADVQRIAKSIIPTKDNFWDPGGRSIFIGIALYLIETAQKTSFGSIYRFANDGTDLQEKFLAILEQEKELSQQCRGLLFKFANIENEKVSGGFLDTFNSRMEPFSNPLIAAATDHSDFDFSKIREEKTTIYLVARPEHVSILGRIFGLINETIIFALTRHEPVKGETGKVLFMFDEFTALGSMDRVKKGSAYFGGYGIRLCMIYQNEAQLQDTYSAIGARELTSLMHERIVFAPSDIQEASNISKELGNQTVKTTNLSYNQGRVSRSVSESAKALMTPESIMLMPNEDEIILSSGQKPIYCKKLTYYNDKRFTDRLLPEYSDGVPTLRVADYEFKELEMNDLTSVTESLNDVAF